MIQRRSLRGRLLYTLFGLLAVLLLLQMGEHFSRLRNQRHVLREEHQRAARNAAAAVRASLDQVLFLQEAIAQATLQGRMGSDRINSYLQEVRDRFPGMASLQVIDAQGNVLSSSPALGFDNDARDEPFFQALSPDTPLYVSDVYSTSPQELDKVRIASLSLTPGLGQTPLGVVAMEFYPAGLQKLMPFPETGERRLVLDGAGKPVLEPGGYGGVISSAALAQAAAQAQQAQAGIRLKEINGAAFPVPGSRWTVVYLPSVSDATARLMGDMQTSLLFVALVVGVLGLAMGVVVQMSLRPVVALSAATRKLGSGDLALRLPPAEVSEFDALVDAFNGMAGQLAAAQNELVRANQGLEERVQERTQALEDEHQKLLRAERLSSLGLFSSAIAHDLRNPLNTVSLCVQWLQLRLKDHADEKVRARLDTIQREISRSDRIIQTLLAFARTGEPNRASADLDALISEVLSVIHPPANVALEHDRVADLPPAPLDRAQMFQVLENLIRNAIQAMPEGGRVRICTRREGAHCVVLVSDSGPGIPPEMQATVFEPLVTTKSTGTGLGLALCKRIVDAHGGRISVHSQPGEGATFRIDLPLEAPEPYSGPDRRGEHSGRAEPRSSRTEPDAADVSGRGASVGRR